MKIYDLKKNPIGAYVTAIENGCESNFYCSFGKYIENPDGLDCDSFGIPDYEIFHSFENLEDLKYYEKNKNKNFVNDTNHKLVSYELYFTTNTWKQIKNIRKSYKS